MKKEMGAGQFKAKRLKELKRGRTAARLAPTPEQTPTLFGRMRGTVDVSGDLVAPIAERWKAEGR